MTNGIRSKFAIRAGRKNDDVLAGWQNEDTGRARCAINGLHADGINAGVMQTRDQQRSEGIASHLADHADAAAEQRRRVRLIRTFTARKNAQLASRQRFAWFRKTIDSLHLFFFQPKTAYDMWLHFDLTVIPIAFR